MNGLTNTRHFEESECLGTTTYECILERIGAYLQSSTRTKGLGYEYFTLDTRALTCDTDCRNWNVVGVSRRSTMKVAARRHCRPEKTKLHGTSSTTSWPLKGKGSRMQCSTSTNFFCLQTHALHLILMMLRQQPRQRALEMRRIVRPQCRIPRTIPPPTVDVHIQIRCNTPHD